MSLYQGYNALMPSSGIESGVNILSVPSLYHLRYDAAHQWIVFHTTIQNRLFTMANLFQTNHWRHNFTAAKNCSKATNTTIIWKNIFKMRLTAVLEFPFSSPVRGSPLATFKRRNAQVLGSRAKYLTDWYMSGLVHKYRSHAWWHRWSNWSGLTQRHGSDSDAAKSCTKSLCFSSLWTLEPVLQKRNWATLFLEVGTVRLIKWNTVGSINGETESVISKPASDLKVGWSYSVSDIDWQLQSEMEKGRYKLFIQPSKTDQKLFLRQ